MNLSENIKKATNAFLKALRISNPKIDYKKENQSIVVNKLEVRPILRQSQDIQKWRNAIRAAEGLGQHRAQLYDIYEDVLLDIFLFRALEKRAMTITNVDLIFVDENGKRNDEISSITNKTAFQQLLRHIIDAKFWGHSLVELNWYGEKWETVLIPRKHVKPRYSLVTVNQYDTSGYDYSDKSIFRNYIEIGNCEDLGILAKAAPLAIWKRADISDWAEFAECFGMPTVIGKYNNPETRQVLEQALNGMGSRARITMPQDAQIEYHESKQASGDGGLFNGFREALNEEMIIGILGNSMTTVEAKSSGYAQSETQQKDQNALKKDDRKFVLSVLNESLLPLLAQFGINAKGSFQFVDDEQLSMAQRLDIDIKINSVTPIDASYWYEKYKVPMPTKMPKTTPETDGNEKKKP